MNAISPIDLDPAFIDHLVGGLAAALPADHSDMETARGGARAALLAMKPRDAVEAMMAAQAVAAHYAAMDAFRRAARPDQPDAMAARLRANAAALTKMMQATVRALRQEQAAALAEARPAPVPAPALASSPAATPRPAALASDAAQEDRRRARDVAPLEPQPVSVPLGLVGETLAGAVLLAPRDAGYAAQATR